MNKQTRYKSMYNKHRGLPEPECGSLVTEIRVQCPYCSSRIMYFSAHPDNPEEIIPYDMVRCAVCGHISDWYDAAKLYMMEESG